MDKVGGIGNPREVVSKTLVRFASPSRERVFWFVNRAGARAGM